MIVGEIKTGQNIKSFFRAIKEDFSNDEKVSLGDPVIIKCSANGATPVNMTGATYAFDSDMNQWLLDGPSSFVPSYGFLDITIKGTNIDYVMIRLAVSGGGGGGMGVLTKDYTVSGNDIQFTDTSIDKRDIVKIRGISSNLDIYDCNRITAGKNDITLSGTTPGLFTCDYHIPAGETLKIWLES